MDELVQSKDSETLEEFRTILTETGGRQEHQRSGPPALGFPLVPARPWPQTTPAPCAPCTGPSSRTLAFVPVIAANGEEAYDFIENGEEFDIIITDMNMPVMDGMELVTKIRSTSGMEDVPIIMVTTESEVSQQDLASKAGVTAFITKPFRAG